MDNQADLSAGKTAKALDEIWRALGGDAARLPLVAQRGEGELPSAFAVSDLASASIAAAGAAIGEWIEAAFEEAAEIAVDRRLSSLWFLASLRPQGWSPQPVWDAVAGDYAAKDGWIRLHTNAPQHRAAALAVLGAPAERETVAGVVARWRADDLEAAVVEAGGCAAAMRTLEEWREHEQGRAVAQEPLLAFAPQDVGPEAKSRATRARPLAGVKVLDLTRVLAGPVATRFLAGFGADVLRLDPPEWDEPAVLPEVTLGKRCARLDLRQADGRARFAALLAEADVLVHGYRADALDRLGLDIETRRRIRPGLVDVSLDAYGWRGPWRGRRGFDSLVQMSAGIAAEGMRRFNTERPKPLPAQALDHATGYLMAAAATRGLTLRRRTGCGSSWRASLARTAALLTSLSPPPSQAEFAKPQAEDFSAEPEATSWGPALRLEPPLTVAGAPIHWDRAAGTLGSAPANW